jgi:hypothetical protein
MLRHAPLALLAGTAIVILLTAAIPQRLNRVLNPPQIEIQISTEPAVGIRILPFPMEGPFGDSSERTEEELQKLLREFGVRNK